MQQLLAGRKTDQVSIVIAGTEGTDFFFTTVKALKFGFIETDNPIALEQPGQYQHISVLSPIKQPDLDMLRKFVNVPLLDSKTSTADGMSAKRCQLPILTGYLIVFDAVILTTSIIREFVRHYKYEKRIRLYTSLEGNINWENISDVNDMLRALGIEISIA